MSEFIKELAFRVAELERKQASQFLYGNVTEISEDGSEAKIELLSGVKTDFLPVLVQRANEKAKTLWRLEKGEHVLVASLGGDPNQGVILGALFLEKYLPKEKVANYVQYENGLTITYDDKKNEFNVDVKPEGIAKININIPRGSANIKAEEINFTSSKNTNLKSGKMTAIDSKKIELGKSGMGVVTGACLCAFTGARHPDVSATVRASK